MHVILALVIVGIILFAGLRIIMSWTLSDSTIARIDYFVDRFFRLYFQLFIVGLAVFIIYVIYIGYHQ
jgi:hypothetical protein